MGSDGVEGKGRNARYSVTPSLPTPSPLPSGAPRRSLHSLYSARGLPRGRGSALGIAAVFSLLAGGLNRE